LANRPGRNQRSPAILIGSGGKPPLAASRSTGVLYFPNGSDAERRALVQELRAGSAVIG
jgi:hypothetical protein